VPERQRRRFCREALQSQSESRAQYTRLRQVYQNTVPEYCFQSVMDTSRIHSPEVEEPHDRGLVHRTNEFQTYTTGRSDRSEPRRSKWWSLPRRPLRLPLMGSCCFFALLSPRYLHCPPRDRPPRSLCTWLTVPIIWVMQVEGVVLCMARVFEICENGSRNGHSVAGKCPVR
jgi:hypothetical protein